MSSVFFDLKGSRLITMRHHCFRIAYVIRNAYGYRITIEIVVRTGFELWISEKKRTVGELRKMLREGSKRITDLYGFV